MKNKFEITAEDILRSIEFGRKTPGDIKNKAVIDLVASKFHLFDKPGSRYYYTFAGDKMGIYTENQGWVTVYEIKDNTIFVDTINESNFYMLYGRNIDTVTPLRPNEIEPDENDTLTKAILEQSSKVSEKIDDETFFGVPISTIADEANRMAIKVKGSDDERQAESER